MDRAAVASLLTEWRGGKQISAHAVVKAANARSVVTLSNQARRGRYTRNGDAKDQSGLCCFRMASEYAL